MAIYFDTNILIAAVLSTHSHHRTAMAALRMAHRHEGQYQISAHGIAEFYAVLTRIPLSPPVHPAEAWRILEQDVFPYFEIISLSADEYRDTLRTCAVAGWSGGRIYDVLHLAAARKASCDPIYTFNLRHFRELAPDLAHQIREP